MALDYQIVAADEWRAAGAAGAFLGADGRRRCDGLEA